MNLNEDKHYKIPRSILELKKANRKIAVLTLICVVLVLLSAVLAGILFVRSYTAVPVSGESEDLQSDTVSTETVTVPNAEISQLDDLNDTIDALNTRIESLEGQLNEAKEALDEKATDEIVQELNAQLDELNAALTAKQNEVDAVNQKIDSYTSLSYLDIGAQAEAVRELYTTLAGSAPYRKFVNGTGELDEEGNEITETKYQYPKIAVYYEDLTTGYSISYNGDDSMYTASIIKAPYIYSVLADIAEFEEKKRSYTPENPDEPNPYIDENGNIIYAAGEEKYDLSRVWTFNKATMDKEGTGKITKMESGVQFTYLELIQYAIEYSDNVAFAALRDLFGYTSYNERAASLGVTSSGKGFMYISAADQGKFMKAIYEFIDSGNKYGKILYDSMLAANHRILIPYAVPEKTVIHKYGWDVDSYHDSAIVYGEHPYVLVIMTDMDTVSDSVNGFIRNVTKQIDTIHENFYHGISQSLLDRFTAAVEGLEAKVAEE